MSSLSPCIEADAWLPPPAALVATSWPQWCDAKATALVSPPGRAQLPEERGVRLCWEGTSFLPTLAVPTLTEAGLGVVLSLPESLLP